MVRRGDMIYDENIREHKNGVGMLQRWRNDREESY